jgi:hypothetical protein
VPLLCVSDELKNFFSKHGNVVEHEIIRDHNTKRSRGFGFVVFDDDKVVDNLLADGNKIDMDGTQVSSVHFFRVFKIGTANTDDKLLIICFDVKVKECCCEIIDNWGFMLRSKSNNKASLNHCNCYFFAYVASLLHVLLYLCPSNQGKQFCL